MKRIILSMISIALFIGCASKKYSVFTSFYQVEKTDSVRIDSHSIDLDSMRVLIVSMQDTIAKDLNISQQKKTTVEYESPYNRYKRYNPNQANYSFSRWQGSVEYQFFNNIIARRVTELLKSKTPTALVESKRKIFDEQEVEDINKRFNAGLVAVIRDINFTFDSKNEFSSYKSPPAFPHTYSWGGDNVSQSQGTMVCYQSVWDLFWLDTSGYQVLRKQTIVQTGGYYAGDDGEPLEKVLSCALKAGDDFINLFK
ncbi:hypothetical protein [Bacteroides faecalis]|nr:hypothetical protein [Bacteroides faecalis]